MSDKLIRNIDKYESVQHEVKIVMDFLMSASGQELIRYSEDPTEQEIYKEVLRFFDIDYDKLRVDLLAENARRRERAANAIKEQWRRVIRTEPTNIYG